MSLSTGSFREGSARSKFGLFATPSANTPEFNVVNGRVTLLRTALLTVPVPFPSTDLLLMASECVAAAQIYNRRWQLS